MPSIKILDFWLSGWEISPFDIILKDSGGAFNINLSAEAPTIGWMKIAYFTEPPTPGWCKIIYETEPPVSGAWNKVKYTP